MSTNQSSQMLSTDLPEIEKSDLDAVRKFLTAHREDESQPRPKGVAGPSKGPTVRFGIARARMRSTSKAAS